MLMGLGASHVQGNDVITPVWYCPLTVQHPSVSTPPFLIDCDFLEILWEPPASVGLRMIVTSGSRLVFLKVREAFRFLGP